MNRVFARDLADFGRTYFVARGFSAASADAIAEAAVFTEAFGITTHGLAQWGYIRRALESGRIRVDSEPEVLQKRGAVAQITGPTVPGQVVMRLAIEIAASGAREYGIAMVAVKKSHWIGALGPYLIAVAEKGLLAQAWAQSSACQDAAPIGGIDATFSTNPLAFAAPTGRRPIVADFSTSAVSMGKVKALIASGRKTEVPTFMDNQGQVTDDPAVVLNGGSILFTGAPQYGHKGYALSLWCEAMTALAGGDCNNPALPQSQSFNLTVIDPEAFAGAAYYMKEMGRLLDRIKSVRRLPGVEEVRLPGERGFRCLEQSRHEGIPISEELQMTLDDMAAEAGIHQLPRRR